jgi:plastocyanin
MKKAFATGAALLLAAAVAGMLPGAGRRVHAATTTVSVQDNQYNPASVTINVGDTVQWNWTDSNPHTVSSTGAESFDSSPAKTSGSFTHTFSAIGSFGYVCSVHGSIMSGTVVVQAAPATNTPTSTPTVTSTPAATNTLGPTDTPGAKTPTRTPTETPVATSTPRPSATAAAAAPTIAITQPAVAASPGSAAAGAQLPRAGSGSAGGASGGWLSVALAAAGLAVIAGAVVWRRRA